MTKKFLTLMLMLLSITTVHAANKYDNPDTLFVSRDGTCEFRNIAEAIEVCRAFMDYHKVIFVKRGTYKEKIEIPSWLTNIEICGEDRDNTIITWDDHANIHISDPAQGINLQHQGKPMGTFRTFTVKVTGSLITFKDITIENNAARLGQAVALHVEGDRCLFLNCRFLGHQDTVYTGRAGARQYFRDCYIEGTTDFIFGPSTAWFENCDIVDKSDSYVTAASTPKDQPYGYIFNRCRITCLTGDKAVASNNGKPITRCFLGRPWRPYAYTLFMNCTLGQHIVQEGWQEWAEGTSETARYIEYNNVYQYSDGKTSPIDATRRVAWSHQLTKKEASRITPAEVFSGDTNWIR